MSTYTTAECIENCTNCHNVCYQMALTHCLEAGGEHTEPTHFRLMMDCAKICETSATLQLAGSMFCADICKLCAKICNDCATDCERIGGMEKCVEACRRCAESCSRMAA